MNDEDGIDNSAENSNGDERYNERGSSHDDGVEIKTTKKTPRIPTESELRNFKIRGLTVDTWFSIFMQLALVLSAYNDPEDGYRVLDAVRNMKILSSDDRKDILPIVNISCAYHGKDPKTIVDIIRSMSGTRQHNDNIYRLFLAALGTGTKAVENYRTQHNQKVIVRRVQAMDAQAKHYGKPISCILYSTLGYIYMNNRSYEIGMGFFEKILAIYPHNGLINLCMGVSNIYRAMNRLSSNRHGQILQGLSYMNKYLVYRKEEGEEFIKKKIESLNSAQSPLSDNIEDQSSETNREKDYTEEQESVENTDIDTTNWELQESYFNMGRAFHGLGLNTEALGWYEKALNEFPDVVEKQEYVEDQHESIRENVKVDAEAAKYTLKPNSAYNLIQLYVAGGNLSIARDLADKYLVI